MRRLANKFFGLFGYALVRKTARMSSVDDYVAWSKRVFGEKIYPVLDPSLKAATSLPTDSPVFDLVAGGLDAAEMRYAQALLKDIKDRKQTNKAERQKKIQSRVIPNQRLFCIICLAGTRHRN